MIDIHQGWRHGFPKYVEETRGHELLDMTIDELYEYLVDEGYPHELATQHAGWCRFMWIEDKDER